MKKLLAAAGLAMLVFASPVHAQSDADVIRRLNELELKHKNAAIDAAALGETQSVGFSGKASRLRHRCRHRAFDQAARAWPPRARWRHPRNARRRQASRNMPSLWSVSAATSNWTDAHVEALQDVKKLATLALTLNRDVSDAAVASIASYKGLKNLQLDGTSITDSGLAALEKHPSIERLSLLSQLKATDAALDAIGTMPALRALNLTGTAVTGSGFAKLGGTKLEELVMMNTPLSDEGVAHLAETTKMKRLFIWQTPITDAALEPIARMPNVETLYLDKTKVTDAGLAALSGHPALRTLWLSSTAVTDAGMSALTDTKLGTIMLNKTAISDEGIKTLAAIPTLTNISVRDTKVTAEGVAAAMEVPGRNEKLRISN